MPQNFIKLFGLFHQDFLHQTYLLPAAAPGGQYAEPVGEVKFQFLLLHAAPLWQFCPLGLPELSQGRGPEKAPGGPEDRTAKGEQREGGGTGILLLRRALHTVRPVPLLGGDRSGAENPGGIAQTI